MRPGRCSGVGRSGSVLEKEHRAQSWPLAGPECPYGHWACGFGSVLPPPLSFPKTGSQIKSRGAVEGSIEKPVAVALGTVP